MTDDSEDNLTYDDLDPTLVRSFELLERIPVPDVRRLVPRRTEVPHRPRRPLLVAAAVLAIGAIGTAMVLQRDSNPSLTGAPSTVSHAPDDSGATTSSLSPTAALTWRVVRPEGSMSRSGVTGIVAGPNGFVATGIGLDDGVNQGRVWHSFDGINWTEPALELFDAITVGAPVATSDAYYVLGDPNPDRSATVSSSWAIYRSVDGLSWQKVTRGDGAVGVPLGAAGDVLLGESFDSPLSGVRLLTSTDGATWQPATLVGGSTSDTLFGDVTTVGSRYYLASVEDSRFQVWESSDGLTWKRLPTPPGGGPLAPILGSIGVLVNPRAEECSQPTDVSNTPEEMDAVLRARWDCVGVASVHYFIPAADVWKTVTTAGPGPTPQLSPVVEVAGRLVSPVLQADGTLTASTSIDGVAWNFIADNTPTSLNGSSPSPAFIAANETTVVLATPGGLSGFTNLIVGSAAVSQASPVAIEEQSTATSALSELETRSAPSFEQTPFEVTGLRIGDAIPEGRPPGLDNNGNYDPALVPEWMTISIDSVTIGGFLYGPDYTAGPPPPGTPESATHGTFYDDNGQPIGKFGADGYAHLFD